jgi:hypothetical protein
MNKQLLVLFDFFILFVVINSSDGFWCLNILNKLKCVDLHHFQKIINIMGQDHLIGLVTACPEGKICDDSLGNAICRIDQLPTTTTELPVTPPSCFDSGKYPGPICYQYYECVKVLWWWQSKLKDCPVGQAFDETVEECNTAAWSKCQPTTTIVPTTTSVTYVSPVTGPPACFGPGIHPAETCFQYYQCVPVLWWWQPQRRACLPCLAFDISLKQCTEAAFVDCTANII